MPKDSIRVEAYGTVDEVNSVLGLVRSVLSDSEIDSVLEELQRDLFISGADLAGEERPGDTTHHKRASSGTGKDY